MRLLRRKKFVIPAIVGIMALLGGVAYAYFSSGGTGTGAAQVGSAAKELTITQIGAGYDSLVAFAPGTDPYIEDQCLQGCSGPSELGNDITLANSGYQQLVSVVLAVRNWGGQITNGGISLYLSDTVNGAVTIPLTMDVPPAISDSQPYLADETFDLASQDIFVPQTFVYGFSYNDASESGLNIALSSSANDLAVGFDAHPGSIWVDDSSNNGDFPACVTFPSGFGQMYTNGCGAQETGAYGLNTQVAAGNADIPAVEFNVVGGVIPSLYPGGPAQPVDFAILNPNTGNVGVNAVTFTFTVTQVASAPGSPASPTCLTTWFTPVQPSLISAEIPPGTTIFSPSGGSISLVDLLPVVQANNQDSCEGATLNLTFTST